MKRILACIITLGLIGWTTTSIFAQTRPCPTCPPPETPDISTDIDMSMQQQQSQEATADAKGGNATVGNINVDATGGRASAGISHAGNSQVSIQNKYVIPMRLITPQMIDPVVTDDVLFPELDGQTYNIDDNISVLFIVTNDSNRLVVLGLSNSKAPNLLATAQNHGKKVLARFQFRTNEFVGPVEQARELAQIAPKGTRGMVVRIKTSQHTRGAASVIGAGHNDGSSLIESVTANMAGSYYLPFVHITASYYDQPIKIKNCNHEPTDALCTPGKGVTQQ